MAQISGAVDRLLFVIALSLLSLSTAKAQSWIQLAPSGTPPSARGWHGASAVTDPTSNRMIVFGGGYPNVNDVWVLTNADGTAGSGQWINLIPNGAPGSPAPRGGHSAVFDSVNDRMIIFGGCLGGCLPTANDVWVLTNANGLAGTPAWQQLSPTGTAPAGRTNFATVYDQANNRMTVYGGQNGGGYGCSTYSDIWVLSNANGLGGTPSWSQLSPTGGPPAGQYGVSGAYDPSSNTMTVFGGGGIVNGSCVDSNAAWILSNANGLGGAPSWTNLTAEGASGSPSPNAFVGLEYDLVSNHLIDYDGAGVWVLTHANGAGGVSSWSQVLATGIAPSSRGNMAVTFDSASDRMTVFGGNDATGALNDTWVLTNADGVAGAQDASLVSYWPLDYGQAIDLVGGNNGTTVNTTASVGIVNGALHFDGIDSMVTTPYAPSLDSSQMAQVTAEAWARFSQNPPVLDTYLLLVGKEALTGPCCWSFELVVRQHPSLNGGQPFFTWLICGNQQCNDFEGGPYATVPSDTNWHHVAGSYDSGAGVASLYVDGALARTWTTSTGRMQNDPHFGIQIGNGYGGPACGCIEYPFDIDEVALWSRALSPSEILNHYQAGLTGLNYFSSHTPTPPTVSFTGAPASAAYGTTFTVSATTNASTTASISATGACSISVTSVTITSGTGTCNLTATWAADSNYSAASLSQSTAAATAPLVVTVASTTKILNAPNPVLNNVIYSGFVFSDGPSSLGGTLTCTTTATTTSAVGSYPITCSGLTSSNYAISYTAGTLKILYAPAGGTCDGDLGHTILQPVNADGTSVWKQGRIIPLKFRVCDANGVSIGSVGLISSFALTQIISGTVTNVDETIDANVADAGFRFDTSAQQWIFNLSTRDENAGYTYVYAISLNDGTSITFQYGLR